MRNKPVPLGHLHTSRSEPLGRSLDLTLVLIQLVRGRTAAPRGRVVASLELRDRGGAAQQGPRGEGDVLRSRHHGDVVRTASLGVGERCWWP